MFVFALVPALVLVPTCLPALAVLPAVGNRLMLNYVLYLALLATRLHAAFYAIIPDCDEVYNYWEPLNFLTRFFGKQTWEYSPEFAIRSYAYLCQFSIFIYPIKLSKFFFNIYNINLPSYTLFYLIRIILALSFTFSEIKLSKNLKFLNKKIQNWFLLAQILSPGMYQASISILPNSYSLLLGILASNFIINYFNALNFAKSIDNELFNLEIKINKINENDSEMKNLLPRTNILLNLYRISTPLITKYFTAVVLLYSISGLCGWPFSMILILPFLIFSYSYTINYIPISILKNDYSKLRILLAYTLIGIFSLFFISFFISQFDYLFYKKTVFFSFNIINYNIFNSNAGPNLFGTESWDYYIKNLFLNYHIFFLIATLNFLTIPTIYQLTLYKFPLLIWFAIFFYQPHKEERFLYPIYHLISISFAQFMSCETFNYNKLFKLFKLILNILTILLTSLLFLSRVNNLNSNYSAPLKIFKYLSDSTTLSNLPENICLGREWYHYPSSFFLNNNQRLKFTKSNFNGMLPNDFIEPIINNFEGLVNSTSKISNDFNNLNIFNPNSIINPNDCNYFIDIDKITSIDDKSNLNDYFIIICEDLIDQDSKSGIEKSFGLKLFFNKFIINYWFNLQSDLSVIELNRKLMQMYGIKNPVGTKMFDNFYIKLNHLNNKFGYILGDDIKTNKLCLAKKK